jgi:alpha-D-ribose 1-methylphosphonate 5-triphosphate synthase subunit PhnL
MTTMIRVEDLSKTFVLHLQAGTRIPVLGHLTLEVATGECVSLNGPSGVGKSTLLRSLYGNYLPDLGKVMVRHRNDMVDLAIAEPRQILEIRRETIGYVSQFLRAIPRVPCLEIVAEPARALGVAPDDALARAKALLRRLRIPDELHDLAPATFSGGEQQRVNIARGFAVDYPILLLDEPTASLDADNRDTVLDLIGEARNRGAAVVGIFHDRQVRERVADRGFDLHEQRPAA